MSAEHFFEFRLQAVIIAHKNDEELVLFIKNSQIQLFSQIGNFSHCFTPPFR